MRKIYLKRAIALISIAMIVLGFIVLSGRYFFCNYNDTKIRTDGFYLEDKNTLDVVFVGASETFSDFAPGYAYEQFGFTSYVLGVPAGSCYLTKYQLQEVMQYQQPKLIVIEINSFLYETDGALIDDVKLRTVTDNMPISKNKIEIIQKFQQEDPLLSYYFPFLKYHGTRDIGSAWLNMKSTIELENRGYSLLKGMSTTAKIYNCDDIYDLTQAKNSLALNPKADKVLRELLLYCQEKKVNVLFTRFPHIIEDQAGMNAYMRANKAGEIIEDYGFEFINFEGKYKDMNLDMNCDFYNPEHMNIYGQRKFTEYFGQMLCDTYNVESTSLPERQKSEWEESAKYTSLLYQYVEKRIGETGGDADTIFENSNLILELRSLEPPK